MFENIIILGWDETQVCLKPLPSYFPSDMIKLELPIDQFPGALTRLPRSIRSMSIQAEYIDDPVSAKLVTLENIELMLNFWVSVTKEVFYMDIQRRRGDHLTANQYVHKLLDAARGTSYQEEEDLGEAKGNESLDAKNLQNVKALLNKCVSSSPVAPASSPAWLHPMQSPEDVTKTALGNVHHFMSAKQEKMALELLSSMTDLRYSLSSTAVSSAIVVLLGRAPCSEYGEICETIQKEVFRMLLQFQQVFHGNNNDFSHDSLIADCRDTTEDCTDRSPWRDDEAPPRVYSAEYAREHFHLALTVVINALEVVSCFQDDPLIRPEDAVETFLQTATAVSRLDVIQTLKECLLQSEHNLHVAYLATKALRLVGQSCPRLRESWKNELEEPVRKATELGCGQHALLLSESEKLWDWLYASH
jgi:hypothetical protein